MKSTKKTNSKSNYGKGFSSLKEHWRDDLKAGFGVSLLALPLSLGIAMASGFPPIAGLFAAIVGGLIVSRINGSWVTITGPAAGLIVVNLAAVESLGLENALGAIFISGLIIIAFGFLKSGKFGDFFPHSAVHGMLSAIGVIIMVKQFFVAVGVKAEGHEFYEIMGEIPKALMNANPSVVLISIVSLFILIMYPKINLKVIKLVPAPIWVLAVAIPMEFLLDFEHEHVVNFMGSDFNVGPKLLIHLPEKVTDGIVIPKFDKISQGAFWVSVMTISLVTAIESLLSAIAVDSMDPIKRKSDLNQDLKGLGAGASISSAIGGLPMISEIVRSSANIANGAKTQWSNFFHGLFLTIFLFFGGFIIDHIPLAALASMLIFTGFRLASPKEFKHVYEIGKSEFVVFVTTLVMVLVTDLLVGIALGILTNFIINIFKGMSLTSLFKTIITEEQQDDAITLRLQGAIGFSNYLSLKKYVLKHAEKKHLILNMKNVTLLDHSTVHHLHEIERDRSSEGKTFEIIQDKHLVKVSNHSLSEKRANIAAVQKIFSDREIQIQSLASKNNWEYYEESFNIGKWERYPTFKKNRVVREHNVIKLEISGYTCTIADIELRAPDTLRSAENNEITALNVDLKMGVIPSFTLEKEELFDKIVSKIVWEDINFDSHPEFSKHYLLKGLDRDAIRAYFNTNLLNYLQKNMGYHIESNKKGLLIYLKNKPLDIHEINTLIAFTEGFLGLWI